jgi:hypothetical protein
MSESSTSPSSPTIIATNVSQISPQTTSRKAIVGVPPAPNSQPAEIISTSTILAIINRNYNLGAYIDTASITLDRARGNLFFSNHPDKDTNADLYRYDFINERLTKMDADDNVNVYSLSPNGEFAALDFDTDLSERGLGIFDVAENKFILRTTHSNYDRALIWSPDSTQYMLSRGTYDISVPLCASGGALDSVYVQKVTDMGLNAPLYRATGSTGYEPERWIGTLRIVIRMNTYSDTFPSYEETDCSNAVHWQSVYDQPLAGYIACDLATGAKLSSTTSCQ